MMEKVLGLVEKIPKGKVTTYGEVARALGTRGYRAVGQALRGNPRPFEISCHRVVRSDGRAGGYGGRKKLSLLLGEDVEVLDGKVNLEKHFWRPGRD